jgi:putative Mn2+ efflux pump MntP
MNWNFAFFFNSVLLGIGLAMDAFSVSLANGLNEPKMKRKKMISIAGVFAFFQALMPMLGWVLVRALCNCFSQFQTFIPWIALILLGFIGGKMLLEGIKDQDSEEESCGVGFWALILQGIATSIDALSVGFTISEYGFFKDQKGPDHQSGRKGESFRQRGSCRPGNRDQRRNLYDRRRLRTLGCLQAQDIDIFGLCQLYDAGRSGDVYAEIDFCVSVRI